MRCSGLVLVATFRLKGAANMQKKFTLREPYHS